MLIETANLKKVHPIDIMDNVEFSLLGPEHIQLVYFAFHREIDVYFLTLF